ncbi:MAG: hypothetical protein B6244_08415 [Candidatus Cloacimonetes bacterium 4572_55]|nr:MAG: hypothetical protein B6244_08415 [Candidatus Cloacimonetes bacterium 4572_55]
MDDRSHTVKVIIFGTEYSIKGDANPKYVSKLARYVDEKMLDLTGGSTSSATVRLAVMAALNVADELFQLKEEFEKSKQQRSQLEEVDQKLVNLTKVLDSAILSEKESADK